MPGKSATINADFLPPPPGTSSRPREGKRRDGKRSLGKRHDQRRGLHSSQRRSFPFFLEREREERRGQDPSSPPRPRPASFLRCRRLKLRPLGKKGRFSFPMRAQVPRQLPAFCSSIRPHEHRLPRKHKRRSSRGHSSASSGATLEEKNEKKAATCASALPTIEPSWEASTFPLIF